MTRTGRRLIALGLWAGIAATSLVARNTQTASDTMMELSSAVKGIQEGLDARDLPAVRAQASKLERAAASIPPSVRPLINTELDDDMNGSTIHLRRPDPASPVDLGPHLVPTVSTGNSTSALPQTSENIS